MATDILRYNARQALITEINHWLGRKKNVDSSCRISIRHVRELLRHDMNPWAYIKKSNDHELINECAYCCLMVAPLLPAAEKEFMDKWLTDEGFYDTAL